MDGDPIVSDFLIFVAVAGFGLWALSLSRQGLHCIVWVLSLKPMQLPYDRYSNYTQGNLPREMKIYVHTKTFTGMLITVLLITVKKWK